MCLSQMELFGTHAQLALQIEGMLVLIILAQRRPNVNTCIWIVTLIQGAKPFLDLLRRTTVIVTTIRAQFYRSHLSLCQGTA